MKKLRYLFPLLFLFACGMGGDTNFNDIQRMVVHIQLPGDEQYQALDTDNTTQIRELLSSIKDKKSISPAKCGHHGNVDFHKKDGTVLSVDFNYSEGCPQIVYINADGELMCHPLSEEGRQFLLSLVGKGLPKDEMGIVAFHYYGEPMPAGYEGIDSLTLPHGFVMKRVAGSGITPEIEEATKVNNMKGVEEMKARHGKDWMEKFEAETGLKLRYYSAF